MASAWGDAFGSAWGGAWGVITTTETVAPPVQSGFASFDEEWNRELDRIMKRRKDEEIMVTLIATAVTRGLLN